MPTTTPTARKQYGLRWLFAVTALVGVLLVAVPWLYEQVWGFEGKLRRVRIGMTEAEVEQVLDENKYIGVHGGNTDWYYSGFRASLHFDQTGRLVSISRKSQ